jgi:hypothetical protein
MSSQPVTEKIHDPATEDVPTPVRINVVNYYVRKEPLLMAKAREVEVKVRKRDGTTVSFLADVFDIALQLHKDGHDALKIGKSEILTAARAHFGISAPAIPARSRTSPITERGAEMASRAVHCLLCSAAKLEEGRDGGSKPVAADIRALVAEMGLTGEPNTPAVVPFTLVLSASQLADIHPKLSNFRSQLDKIIAHYQSITLEN